MSRISCAILVVFIVACSDAPRSAPEAVDPDVRAAVERVLDEAAARIAQLTDSVDAKLQPVPLLTGAQESALRRPSAQHLTHARALGARPADSTAIAALRSSGRLVELEDSTALWAVRRLEHSVPLVTPDTHALLMRIGREFQAALTELGLPPYRIEVTSVLRTADSQADLRQSNSNAAPGASAHEFGTTVDIAYSSFAAPMDPDLDIDASEVPWLEPRVDRIAAAMLETAAARKSRELQAILGKVLLELQNAGAVLVTLERQQPVFHITVAQRMAG